MTNNNDINNAVNDAPSGWYYTPVLNICLPLFFSDKRTIEYISTYLQFYVTAGECDGVDKPSNGMFNDFRCFTNVYNVKGINGNDNIFPVYSYYNVFNNGGCSPPTGSGSSITKLQYNTVMKSFQVRTFFEKGRPIGSYNITAFSGAKGFEAGVNVSSGLLLQGVTSYVEALLSNVTSSQTKLVAFMNENDPNDEFLKNVGNPWWSPQILSSTIIRNNWTNSKGFLFTCVLQQSGESGGRPLFRVNSYVLKDLNDMSSSDKNKFSPYTINYFYQWIPSGISLTDITIKSLSSANKTTTGNLNMIPVFFLHEKTSYLVKWTSKSSGSEGWIIEYPFDDYISNPSTTQKISSTNPSDKSGSVQFNPYGYLSPFTVSQSLDGSTMFIIYVETTIPTNPSGDRIGIRILVLKRASNDLIGQGTKLGDSFVPVAAVNLSINYIFANTAIGKDANLSNTSQIICEPAPVNINSSTGGISYFKMSGFNGKSESPKSPVVVQYFALILNTTKNNGDPQVVMVFNGEENYLSQSPVENFLQTYQRRYSETLYDQSGQYELCITDSQPITTGKGTEFGPTNTSYFRSVIDKRLSLTDELKTTPILPQGTKYPKFRDIVLTG